MDDPIWITKELVLAIHSRQLAEHGGIDGVRDEGILDSAPGRPRNRFGYGDPTPNVPTLAASYAYGIARNHAFLDGNKRTAYVVCRTFLLLNGFDLTADPVQRYTTFLSVAEGAMTEAELSRWLTDQTTRTK
jgi:death-on-curing protein